MKKKINKNKKIKNFGLNFISSLAKKTINKTQKKVGNFISNYQQQKIKEKIESEKKAKAERKKEILREQRLLKKEKLQKLKEEKLQIVHQKKLITDNEK